MADISANKQRVDGIPERGFQVDDRDVKTQIAGRIREAFDGAINADIARRMNRSRATVKMFMDGDRFPNAENLIEISQATGINIHWLLTGRGSRRVETENAFSEKEEELIREVAAKSGRSFDEQVRASTLAAIEFQKNL